MGRCRLCDRESKLVSSWLGVCSQCLREKPDKALELVRRTRRKWRLRLGLPPQPPRNTKARKIKCQTCVNECEIPEGGSGYCGVWRAVNGELQHVAGSGKLLGFTYLDPYQPIVYQPRYVQRQPAEVILTTQTLSSPSTATII